MAFDRPIEADSVDDLGLLSSIIRAPVVGIMWLLGGDHANEAEEEERQKREKESVEQQLMATDSESDCGDVDSDEESEHTDGDNSKRCRGGAVGDKDDDPPDPHVHVPKAALQNQGNVREHDKSNKENELSSLPNWPSVGFIEAPDEDVSKWKSKQELLAKRTIASPESLRQIRPQENDQSSAADPATEMIGDLVAIMESSHISDQKNGAAHGPATSAVLTSQSKITSSSSNSLTASYSASTFSNHHTSQTLSLNSSIANNAHPSQTSTQSNSNSSIRGNKKMSWSDECGNRSLVEYSDSADPPRSKHWSAMRRNGSKTSRRNSFDAGGKTRRSEVRVIKSALRRSGSYSPPVTMYGANGVRSLTASTSSSLDSSSSRTSSCGQMKSFKSISVIGSSDSSHSSSSDHLSRGSTSALSTDTSDSMAAVTNKKLNAKDMQCVPSTLQVGCGRASGGLIIPRGGPSDPRYYFPNGGANDPRYQLILGAGISGACPRHVGKGEEGEKGEISAQDVAKAKMGGSPNPATTISGGRSSPGHPHFLPRTNGYVSPQYGFYVNITPPTPELYAKAHEKSSKHAVLQQQSYQQFQYQSKYQAPSPIPEGAPGVTQGIPQRFVGRSSVPRPSSNRSSQERDQPSAAARQKSLKPSFTNNKKGMGMILAENPHHGVWPSVPFG